MNLSHPPGQIPFGLIDRYFAVNEKFGNPFSLALSSRGHYSEINCMLAGMVYGLAAKRRYIVEETGFEGLGWSELYRSTLPTAPASVVDSIDPEWSSLLFEPWRPRFDSMRRRVTRRHKRRIPIWNRELALFGSVFRIMRVCADAFCQPATSSAGPIFSEPYAAFHVRRGDKVLGSLLNGQRTVPEADVIPASSYLDLLRRNAPDVRNVWVMSDDYRPVEELRALAPDITFETFCSPSSTGYEQTEFSAKTPAQKTIERQKLINETEIAIRSKLFIGGFLSNVDRFIVLRHRDPAACFSVDWRKSWFPG